MNAELSSPTILVDGHWASDALGVQRWQPRPRRPKKHRDIDEDVFRQLWDAGLTYFEMANHFDCSTSRIGVLARRLGVPRRNKGRRKRDK